MKTPKPDQLFKNKLGNQKIAPPPGAWSAIENNLKNQKVQSHWKMMRVVAAILALLAAAAVFYLFQSPEPQMNLAGEHTSTDTKQDFTAKNEEGLNTFKQESEVPDFAEARENTPEPVEKISPAEPEIEYVASYRQHADELKIQSPEINLPATDTSDAKIANPGKIVIEYIVSTQPGDTSDRKEELIAAESPVVVEYISRDPKMVADDKKEKPLKKMIQVALDIKNGEFGLAEIREAKDEILSIELNKIKTQNKDESQQ